MKQSPQLKKLEELMRSSKLVAGGFLGDDPRSLPEIIEADAAEVERLGYTLDQIADRMDELTQAARKGLGTGVRVGDAIEVSANDTRGVLPCPWPHSGRYGKTLTTVKRFDTGQTIRWSDLSVHAIRAHGFFQGRATTFRLEPRELVTVIFGKPQHAASA